MHLQFGQQNFAGSSIQQIQDELDAFKRGLETGKNWPTHWNHIPGGPHAWNDATHKCRRQWFKGFQVGISSNQNLPSNHPARGSFTIFV